MPISIFSNIKITIFFIVSLFLIRINSQPTHDVFGSCHGNDKADQYKSLVDINKAITQLTSNASNTYFSNTSTGSGSDQFNALYYCRYDYSLQTCRSCVESAFNIARTCLPNKEGDRYFEECMVYYSNNSIYTEREDMSRIARSGGRNLNVEEESNFRQILDKTISNLTNNVTSEFNGSSRYFATTTEKYSSTETLYAVGQCNPYIASSLNCSTCLQSNFDWFMTTNSIKGKTYAQIFSPICRLSYLLSNEELSRPWDFQGYIDRHPDVSPSSSSGTRGRSIIGAMIASISGVALCLKLLL